jgi:histidinol-phosphate/aromatic aminotransferase/cobyric acid decarboxylase-like protein
MKWREKIGYYAKEIKKEMRETGRSTSGDFDSLEGFYADKEKIKKALSRVDELIELYDDEDKEKVVDLKEIKKLLSVSSINEARENLIAYKGADSYLEEIKKILES